MPLANNRREPANHLVSSGTMLPRKILFTATMDRYEDGIEYTLEDVYLDIEIHLKIQGGRNDNNSRNIG